MRGIVIDPGAKPELYRLPDTLQELQRFQATTTGSHTTATIREVMHDQILQQANGFNGICH